MNAYRNFRMFHSMRDFDDFFRRVDEKCPKSEFESPRHRTVGRDAAIREVEREDRMRPEFL